MEKQRFFNEMASSWESPVNNNKGRLKEILDLIEIKQNDVILDVGAGTGELADFISQNYGCINVIKIDYAINMLKKSPDLSVNADATNLPFLDESFTKIICLACFNHIKNQDTAMSEFYRVLKKGGELSIFYLDNKRSLDKLHREIGEPVASDVILDLESLRKLLIKYNLSPKVSKDDEYYLTMAKKE